MRKIFTFLISLLLVFEAQQVNAVVVVINTGVAGTPISSVGPIMLTALGSFKASRYAYLYTQSELAAAAIPSGAVISALGWMKNSATPTVSGGKFRIYMKNSSATAYNLASETWANLNSGTTMVYENLNQLVPATMNPTYIDYTLNTPFTYTGGAIEISVEWDATAVSGNPGSGELLWMWSTVPDRIYGASNTTLTPLTSLSSTTSNTAITGRRPFIQITYNANCTGTPSVATAAGPSTAVCSGTSFNLTATGQSTGAGISYRWQSRTGSTGPFTYIAGATTVPYAAGAMANSQYRLVTTCSFSNLADTSNIISVNTLPLPNVDSISETHNAVGVYNFLSHGATNVTSYSWNFGDATPLGTGAAPIHTYVSSGTYTVRLITTNSCGTDTVTKTINVVVPPQCITSPNPLNLTSPANTVCANTSLIITANNASTGPASWHVWQSSPAGSGNWTTLAVNKDTTFTTFITATTDFRMRDSCAIPPGAVSSNVLQIALPAAPQITAIARSNTGLTYNFSATGVANVTSYVWNFGDNTPTSTLPSPTHTYAVNGDYMVTVTVSNGCTSEIRIIKFSTINVGVNTLNIDDTFRVYPNPANQYVDISANDKMQMTDLSLINSMGMEVKTFNNIQAKDFRVDTKDLPVGNYFLRINTASGIISKSFQVMR